MYLKKLDKPVKFAGTHEVYSSKDENLPPICYDWTKIKEGDWIQDNVGTIARVLAVKRFIRNGNPYGYVYGENVLVITCFGRDQIVLGHKKGVKLQSLVLDRKRLDFYSLVRDVDNQRFTPADSTFLFLYCHSGRLVDSYCIAYERTTLPDKYTASRKYKLLIQSSKGKEYMKTMLADEMKKRGLDKEEFYLDKMKASIEGRIETAVELRIFQMLGMASGNEEIIKLVNPESNYLPSTSFPTSSLPKAEEASYSELTEHQESEGLKV